MSERVSWHCVRIPLDPVATPRPRASLIPLRTLDQIKRAVASAVKMREVMGLFSSRVYTPEKAGGGVGIANFKRVAARCMSEARPPWDPDTAAVELLILAAWELPPSLHRKREPVAARWQTSRGSGDWDNVGKPISDVATEIGWWRDDCQVVRCTVERVRREQGAPGFVAVAARELREFETSHPLAPALMGVRR